MPKAPSHLYCYTISATNWVRFCEPIASQSAQKITQFTGGITGPKKGMSAKQERLDSQVKQVEVSSGRPRVLLSLRSNKPINFKNSLNRRDLESITIQGARGPLADNGFLDNQAKSSLQGVLDSFLKSDRTDSVQLDRAVEEIFANLESTFEENESNRGLHSNSGKTIRFSLGTCFKGSIFIFMGILVTIFMLEALKSKSLGAS